MKHDEALELLSELAVSDRRLAKIIGMSAEHISRWRAGRYPIPEWIVAMAEIMERLPRKDWPERWTT